MDSHADGARSRGRPPLEIADILRAHEDAYRAKHSPTLEHERILRDITRCRTPALGGHLDVCTKCNYSKPSYNSCRNRHCPKCQGLAQALWVEQRKVRVLPVRHFHVVFTLPHELNPVALGNRRVVFDLLFRAAAETLLAFGRNERWLGAQLGITAVLHTWTRELLFHPHLHCVVSDGGLSETARWLSGKGKGRFLFPVKALAKVFRAKFLDGLTRKRAQGKLRFEGDCSMLADDASFDLLCKKVASKPWVVYAKRPFKGPGHVFEYLGRYTHRVAISNHRLTRVDQTQVTFRTKDGRSVTLDPLEFMRRFFLHALPSGFVKIRHYGLYASGNVNTKLLRAHEILNPESAPPPPRATEWQQRLLDLTGIDLTRCPRCAAKVVSVPIPGRPARHRAQLVDPEPAPI